MKHIEPDRAALEIAHSKLRTQRTLEQMLAHPAHRKVLETLARKHMRQRDRLDVKKLQAGDLD